MAKKVTHLIEYRYESSQAWKEYARTSVTAMIENYKENARREYFGAHVRSRPL